MTSQPKTTSGPSESAAGNTADNITEAAPLDRSSAEWRSQFGVLPSAYQQSGAARPSPAPGRSIVPPVSPAAETPKRSPAGFVVGAVAVLGVVGLIAYGYFPSQRSGETEKAEGNPAGAVLASGSSVKSTRDKVASTPSPAPTKAPVATPAAVAAKTAPVKISAVKVTAKPVPVPVPARRVVQAAVTPAPKVANPEPTPKPRREKPQSAAPVVRSASAPVVAVVATPRPEPKAAAVKPAPKPAAKPAPQQLPKAARPNSDIESDGTNPLGLPQ